MEQLLLFVKDPKAIDNWSKAANSRSLALDELDQVHEYATESVLVLAQLDTDGNNAEALKALLSEQYPVLLFSNTPCAEEAFEWFQLGIKGYLNTYATVERIMQAISVIQDGHIWLGQTVMNALIKTSTEVKKPKANDSWKSMISEREQQTLSFVMEGKSNSEIADKMFISERTVKAHMSKLLEKFGAKDRLGLVLKIQNWQD